MSLLNPFNQNLRRSSSLLSLHTYQDFMVYASECRDEIEVYFYMEEEKIGIDEPDFWMAMLTALKQRCQLKLLVKKLTQLRQITTVREQSFSQCRHPKFLDICDFQHSLVLELELEIHRRKNNKRRSVREFELFSLSKIQKKTRKIGVGEASFEIYVDEENREKYKLNDLSEFVTAEMTDYVLAKARSYEERRAQKPYSFLGRHENDLEKWSKELIEANKRKSQMLAISNQANARQSNVHRNTQHRLSVSRKSNILYVNNPEKVTPNVPIKIPPTPSKHLRTSEIYKERQSVIFSTPKVQTTIPRNVVKAKKRRADEFESFKQDQEDELSVLEQELHGLNQFSDPHQNTLEYPLQRQIIRIEHRAEQMQINFIQEIFDKVNLDKDLYEKEEQLNIGRLDISEFDQRENQSFPNLSLGLKYPIWQNESFEKNVSNNDQSQNQLVGVLIGDAFSPRKDIQSNISNDQNIFTIQKNRQPPPQFKKAGKPFRVLTEEEILERQNYYKAFYGLPNEQEISEIEDVDSIESEGDACYKEIIEEIEKSTERSRLRENQNLVLETMKKMRLEEVYQREIKKEPLHPNGTHSDKKRITPARLAKISEENSYNSERKPPERKNQYENPFYTKENEDEE